MAGYAYKDVYGVVPEDFEAEWCEKNGVDQDELMEGDPIDWPQWTLMADYISYLESQLKA